MKKFVSIVLCVMCVALASIGLVGCGEEDKDALPDLADCEIGYELPVYPDFEFDYVIDEECTIHMTSIKATLIEKNKIDPNVPLTEQFFPYVFSIEATATTTPNNAGRKFELRLYVDSPANIAKSTTTQQDGSIKWVFTDLGCQDAESVSFRSILIC